MTEIILPRLGWNMEEGVFLGWLKRDGENVKVGEPLFSVEGDKSIQEIEATESGILRIAPGGPKEGDTLPVGAVIGHLESSVSNSTATPDQPIEQQVPPDITSIGESPVDSKPSLRESPIIATTPDATVLAQRQAVTPRARKAARDRGISLDEVRGTGRNGRVRERDVLAVTGAAPAVNGDESRSHRLTSLRRTIAQRMVHSSRTTAPVTLHTTIDATNLVNLRDQFKTISAKSEVAVPSFTDFCMKLTALALRDHPLLNARWEEDHILTIADIHIGLAVDTEAGLVVPVVRNVASLSVRQLASQTKTLIDKARARKLAPEDLQGGTFTITNLGSFGVEGFTPIINWPECAILGIGAIRLQPMVQNGSVVARHATTLSLTFDHRVVDGAPAARFLESLRQRLENPSAWLVE